MALSRRLGHALRLITSAAAAARAESAYFSRRSLSAWKPAKGTSLQTAWLADASPIPYALWTTCRQQYHAGSLLLDQREVAVESSTDKWDVGHPPVDESEKEKGGDISPDSAGGVETRSSHTLKPGHSPEPQTDVADTANLDRPKSTGAMLRFNLGKSEERRQRQEEEISSPVGDQDPMQQTREGMSPKAAEIRNRDALEGGNLLWCLGVKVNIKCPGDSSDGAYTILEYIVAPGEGSSMHTHEREDETWYLLEGNLQWQLADKTHDAKEGSCIHLPRGVPHSFANVSDKPARMLVSCVPAGFEKYFLEIGIPVDPDDAMKKPTTSEVDIEAATKAGKTYGISFDPSDHSQSATTGSSEQH